MFIDISNIIDKEGYNFMDRLRKNNENEDTLRLVAIYEEQRGDVFFESQAFHTLIDYYEKDGQYKEALVVSGLAKHHHRFLGDFYLRQAQLLLRMGRKNEALDILETALTIAPNDFEISILLAEVLIRLLRYEEGLAYLDLFRLRSVAEDQSDILLVESVLYEQKAEFDKMFETLRQALMINPRNDTALDRLSLCTELCQKHKQAIDVYQYIIDEFPYSYLAWHYLGHCYFFLGQVKEAMHAYEYSFLANEAYEEGYLDFADLCFDQEQYKTALDTYIDMSNRFDVDGHLLLKIGSCYCELRQYETARLHLEQAARIDAHNDEVFYMLGSCYTAQGKHKTAITFFHKAIRLQPDNDVYYHALGEVAFDLKNYSEAESAYTKAQILAPENSQTWLDLAWFYVETSRVADAIPVLEEASDNLFDVEIGYAYTACLFTIGRRQQAMTALTELLIEDYMACDILYEWAPILRMDKEINALISLYKPDSKVDSES